MIEHLNLEERLEAMTARLERVEKINRLMKVLGVVAIGGLIAIGPLSTAARAKGPKIVKASEFELVSGTQVLAALGTSGGNSSLVFFDSAGKPVLELGVAGAGKGAGVSVLDNNAAVPGGSGKIRAVFGVDPSTNEEGVSTFGSSGQPLSLVGSAADATLSGAIFYDANGALRTGIEYDPSLEFNGFFTEDGSGHNLSLLGNTLAASGILQAGDSFMELLDSANPRVLEFENSTNEGGVDFDPGKFPTTQGSWGNP